MEFFAIEFKDKQFKEEMETKILDIIEKKHQSYFLMGFIMNVAISVTILIGGGELQLYSLFLRVCLSLSITYVSIQLIHKGIDNAVGLCLLLHHAALQIIIFEDCVMGSQFSRLMAFGALIQAQNFIKKCSFYNCNQWLAFNGMQVLYYIIRYTIQHLVFPKHAPEPIRMNDLGILIGF